MNRIIFSGEQSLRRALREYGAHFHGERPHQELGNELIASVPTDDSPTGKIVETERLGGLLRSYELVA